MTIQTFNNAIQELNGAKVDFLRDHTRVYVDETTIAATNHACATKMSQTLIKLANEHGVQFFDDIDHMDFKQRRV